MRARDFCLMALVAGLYFLTAEVGLQVAFVAKQVSTVWPPTGVALAALRILGYRVWPGILAGAFLANLTAEESASTACGIACGNTLEALAGAWLLARFVHFDNAIESFKDALGFVLVAVGFSTMLSATIGVASLCLSGMQRWENFGSLWCVWWFGDAMGDLIVAPAILVWAERRASNWPLSRIAEAAMLLFVLIILSLHVFETRAPSSETQYAYTVFPIVAWAAVRFGQRGSTAATGLIWVVAIAGTIQGYGRFARSSPNDSLILLQTFMAVVTTTGLLLAAATSERTRVQQILQASNRRKDEFMAMLAHELRNPLAPISNAIQIFRVNVPTDPKTRELTALVERQVRQMTRLVDDLLDISRITRDNLQLRTELVDLASIIQNAVETSGPAIQAHAHDLSINLPSEPVALKADPIRLAQVFANLLNNAAKFTPAGGQIDISAARKDGDVVVTVRDNGRGIDAQELSLVFEMFTQLGDSAYGVGMGIGLTLAKRLVELHGGTIEAVSAGSGRGSEFRVRLPALAGRSPAPPCPSNGDGRRTEQIHRRILVVDDNQDSAESLTQLLQALGCDVQMAYDGLKAVEMAGTFRPELVLLDIGMPIMNGYDAARNIRNEAWGTDMVLVALTGWGQDEDRRRSAAAGFDHHLTKPVDLAMLRELLRNLRTRVPV